MTITCTTVLTSVSGQEQKYNADQVYGDAHVRIQYIRACNTRAERVPAHRLPIHTKYIVQIVNSERDTIVTSPQQCYIIVVHRRCSS